MQRTNLFSPWRVGLSMLGAWWTLATSAAAPGLDRLLFQAADEGRGGRWVSSGAALGIVSGREGASMELRTGVDRPWPGAGWVPESGAWDLREWATIEVSLSNAGKGPVKVFCRVDNPGADGRRHCLTADVTLAGDAEGVLRVPLTRYGMERPAGDLFGMRGYPAVPGGEGTIDPARVVQVLLFVAEPKEPHVFRVRRIRATDAYVSPTAHWSDAEPFVPFVDGFGQYRHRDWPGKVQSEADLRARREAEERELAGSEGPVGWSRFGGWSKGPRFEATGFFRTTRHEGRWWLVDPDGYLFWSHGVDCVRMLDVTAIEGREAWFDDFPGRLPEFGRYVVPSAFALKGRYAGRSPKSFGFAGANLHRKYGPDWPGIYGETIHRRLRHWGLNTIGNWSSADVTRLRKTPYTDSVESEGAPRIAGSEGYWGKFPDVYDARFAEALRRGMNGKRGRSAGDPWCLGYFSDNELSWGDGMALAEAALRSPADQPAKKAFVEFLRTRHGTVEALNARWGTAHASWEALSATREVPDRKRAAAELSEFDARVADTYFGTVKRVIREVAPNQLYLGCRFAWANDGAATAAARHCDVVSYNLYRRSVADFVFPGGADVPLIVGEFHFGALDRGLFHTGLVPVAHQAARARAYRDYVEGALRHPQFVGTHWFQWQDEPTTGRVYDEENYQIGLVDVADTPYSETVDAVRRVGASMYATRSSGAPGAPAAPDRQ